MEAAVGTAAGKIAPMLFNFLSANHRLRAELEHDINYIKKEFLMISAAIQEDDDDDERRGTGGDVQRAWIHMVRDLAYRIEDCIDSFTRRIALKKVDAGWFRRRLHRVKTVRARDKFATAIRRLKKMSEEASVLRGRYKREAFRLRERNDNTNKGTLASESEDEEMETSVATVGMDVARDELLELIQQQQQQQFKVISIVGFHGIGKTLLARQAYNDAIHHESQYEARAWVRAAEKGARDVLREILRQLGSHSTTITIGGGRAGSSCHLSKLRATLRECLGTKRFFIVIDDMRTVLWHDIKDAFPVVAGVSSRVMVTTAIQSVANACSSAHGHAYVMRTLADEHSRQLFYQEAFLEDPPQPGDHTQLGTSEALAKCDGLPLALVTTAQFLQSRGNPERWANLCENLGKHLDTEDTLARMKCVLINSYTSLSSQDIKTCLLYLGVYPSGHPIRRGSLIRRWLAEGLIKEDHKRSAHSVAVENFDELVDRSIIQPTDVSSAEVKKCQTLGMMLEFILHKSMCQNFITLLYDKELLPGSNVRWLSVHDRTATRAKMNPNDLCLVRSLTIFGKAHSSVLDFSKYKLMRVLDLEECGEHLGDKHLKEICCNLSLLRYLSLRGAARVTVLPKQIKKLQLLETLDLRGTGIEILPIEVMELPCLIHLFGKFKIQQNVGSRRMSKLWPWLSEKSKLETLAGFVVDNKSQGFTQIMEHMKHLTKVKIWCECTAHDSSNSRNLSKSIRGFIQRGTNLNEARSLSLTISNEGCSDLLDFSLKKDYSYYLSSLKLQGNNICSQLPLFVTVLGGLTKLCLSFPGDHKLSDNILDALSRVRGLEYLKLIATQLDKLIIRQDLPLRSLRHLCVMVEVVTELEIQEGALPRLEFIRLLCKDINGFSGTIQSLPRLKEVALHDGASDETKQEWKGVTKSHPRRPKLMFVETKAMGSEPAVETIPAETTTDTTVKEVDMESEPAAPPTDTTLSVTTLPNVISTKETAQVVTSEMVDDQELMETEPAAEISLVATATDMMTEKVGVEGEPAENSERPVGSTRMLIMTMPPDVISTTVPVKLDGGGHHDADGNDLDNIEVPNENGSSILMIDQMNKESSKKGMEEVAGLEKLPVKDGTQKRGLQSKQRLREKLSSLVAIRSFRQRSRRGQLVPPLG